MPARSAPARVRGHALGLTLGLATTLAFAVRALPWRTVFDPSGVRFFDADSYYHLRRIVHVARHFPQTLAFDPYLGFPDGARAIWTPAFDVGLGLLARGLVGGEPPAIERLAVWVPPLLGALCVAATAGLAWSLFGAGTALVAGLLLALLPAHAHFAQIGYVDHHVATALAAAGLLWAALGVLAGFEGGRPGASPARWAALGLLLGGSLLLWPGCLLHVALVEAGLVALIVTGPTPGRRGARPVASSWPTRSPRRSSCPSREAARRPPGVPSTPRC
jgi:asparagine N-glycosylation enzyme membrane subunit Stt3